MKKSIIIYICLMLSFSLLFCSCSVKNNNEGKTDENTPSDRNADGQGEENSIILPCSLADSLNPFFAEGNENILLASLSYESLFRVKSDYTPEALLADTFTVTKTSVEVTIKSSKFSDGSSVGVQDVIYSFTKAKNSPAYSQNLINVQSAKADGNKITFALYSPDIFALNILTFPVVKNGTAEKTDSVPVGSGAYVYSDSQYIKNDNYGSEVKLNSIRLYNIVSFEYASNAVEIGNVNFLFDDLSLGKYERIEADNVHIGLNNLVYLGLNNSYGALTSSAVRAAVYYAVDKNELSSSAYQGYGKAAPALFNPNYSGAADLDAGSSYDASKAQNILTKSGYTKYSKSGVLTDGKNELKFNLLVNSDNGFRSTAAQHIAEALGFLGFSVTVESLPADKYIAKIAAGDFQMYLGEIKLTENMDFSQFFKDGGAVSKGIDKTLSVCSKYTEFCEGTIGADVFVNSFLDDVPFVPICYREGVAFFKSGINPDFSYAESSLYGNIVKWTEK